MTDLAAVAESVEKIARGFEEFKATNDKALAELKSKGASDPLLEEKLNKISAEMDEQKGKIDALHVAANRKNVAEEGQENTALKEYKSAFFEYAYRGNEHGLKEIGDKLKLEKKGMLVGSDVDGGYFCPPDISNEIVRIVRETSPVRQYAAVGTTGKGEFQFFNNRNEITSNWVGEVQTRTETTTPTYGKNKILINSINAYVPISQDLLDDADRDVEQEYAALVAEEFSIEENTAFISGSGINKPRGFTTYSNGTSWGTIEQVTTAAASSITFDDLMDLVVKLKVKYLQGSVFMMARTTANHIRKKKDGEGQYLWQPSLVAGRPDMLLGYDVAIAEDMAAIATNALSVAFGNFKNGYQIVDRMGIRVIRDIFTAKTTGKVEIMNTKRVGGDVKDFDAIKLLKVQ